MVPGIRDGGRLSTGDIADAVGLSRLVVIRRLKALQDAGIIQWNGNSAPDPRPFWSLAV